MRYRLNRTQAKMLTEGKPLSAGRQKFYLDKKFDGMEILRSYADGEESTRQFFINTDTGEVEVEYGGRK